MEVPIRVGRLQSLREHLQSAPSHGHLTRSLYDGVRGCCFTISFPNSKPSALSYLVFRNFYTASMRLVQNSTDGSSVVLLDEHVLMQHIHCEDDAQNWHLLHLEKCTRFLQLQAKIDVTRLESFCVYLFQPSPLWEQWELHDVKLYEVHGTHPAPSAAATSSATMSSAKPSVSGENQDCKAQLSDSESPDKRKGVGTGSVTNGSKSSGNLEGNRDGCLSKRTSRMALPTSVDSKDVQESAAQCLHLVGRLRHLLHPS